MNPGCLRPPSWCEVHHIDLFSFENGQTNIDDGILCEQTASRPTSSVNSEDAFDVALGRSSGREEPSVLAANDRFPR